MKLRAVVCLLLAPISAVSTGQSLQNSPARPPAEPFVETVYGTRVDDPYRWMERADRAPEVVAFIRESSAPTVAALRAFPGYAELRRTIEDASQAGVRIASARQVGGKIFYLRIDKGAQLAKLMLRLPDGSEQTLYDPATPPNGIGGAINNYSISPSGTIVALHTASGGSEVGAVHFINVTTGGLLPDKLEPVWGEFEVSWLDDTSFTYTRMNPGAGDAIRNMTAHMRSLGGADSVPLLGAGASASPGFPAQDFPVLKLSSNSRWVVGWAVGARADAQVFVTSRESTLAGKPAWREVASLTDRVGNISLEGDTLYLISTKNSSNGELLAIDLNVEQSFSKARVLLPGGNTILENIVTAADGHYILGRADGLGRIFYLKRDASAPVEIKLPMQGTVSNFEAIYGAEGVTFAMRDWFTAPRFYRARGAEVSTMDLDSVSFVLAGARQVREMARSADGTEVPMDILLPSNAGTSAPLPMLLNGYGSYGVSIAQPGYSSSYLGLLKSGGAVAFCGTRGGGERGRSWHEAGRSANKHKAHDDLIACGERLVQLGLTSPEHMTVSGTSAGGLLAPPVALKRPELFTGLIANVAVVNPTRLAAANNGSNQFAEMGDPNTADGYRALLSQDSYEMLLIAKDIPDTMLVVGLNDLRVDPWMSAKFAARALSLFGDRRLILLRTDAEAGHGVGSTRSQIVDQISDMYAFVLNQAGASGFANPLIADGQPSSNTSSR